MFPKFLVKTPQIIKIKDVKYVFKIFGKNTIDN